MRVMGRLRGLLTGLLVSAFSLCLCGEWAAGQGTPTPDQLQTFQGLTPEQQQAVRNALGAAGGNQSYGAYGAGGRAATGLGDVERLQRESMKAEHGEEAE